MRAGRFCASFEGRLLMPIPDDVEDLISRLAWPLLPADRAAFRAACERALLALPACAGEGLIFRTLAPLQRAFFDPPSDYRAGWDIVDEISSRPSKLKAAPPIEHVRYRRQER
jgi:hypothetical protein